MFVEDELRLGSSVKSQKHVDCLNKITKHSSRTVLQLEVSKRTTSTHCCTIRLRKGQECTSADEQWEGSQIKERKGIVVVRCSMSRQTVHPAGEMQIG